MHGFASYELLANEWGLQVRPRLRISVTFLPGLCPSGHHDLGQNGFFHSIMPRLAWRQGLTAGFLSSSLACSKSNCTPIPRTTPLDAIPHSTRPADRPGGGDGLPGAGGDPARPAARSSRRIASFAAERGVTLIPGIERTIQGKHVLLLNFSRAAEDVRTLRRSRGPEAARSWPGDRAASVLSCDRRACAG